MPVAEVNGLKLNYREDGDREGAPVVFANSLGTDYRLWDSVVARLPTGLRIIRYDKRGHGLSECPTGPYSMADLVADIEALLDQLKIRNCLFVGLSIGGMIAQGLAATRLDLVRAMVISNTAAKIATYEIWEERISAARAGGIEALADGTMERWFSRTFRDTPDMMAWRNMMVRQPLEGYLGCSAAIQRTDLFEDTASLSLPTLGIAGSEDGSTPPDLVRETTELVKGSKFHLIRGAGHLPCVEAPDEYARTLTAFLKEIGHI